jgi:hypothetical protein
MANKYPLVSNSATKTIQELSVGDTLVVDNLNVVGAGNIGGDLAVTQNVTVGGNVTVQGSINANLGNVVVENLTVEGKTNLNSVGNITITGGSNNYVLRTDGSGNLTWANIQSEIANAAGANTYVQFNNNNLFGASANFTYNSDTNTLNIQGNANVSTLNATTINPLISNLGAVANVHIAGGSNGYVLATDGSGNLSWVGIDPSVSGDGGNASSSVLLLASLNGGNALIA